jgi:tetratricopeptide (TPR) repeat protein
MKQSQILSIFFSLLLFFAVFPCLAQPQVSRKPALIRDTDVAEGKEDAKEIKVKEQNPALAEQNLKIGNFYYKQKNYSAAIQRYLDALEYQQNSILAQEALARAYEKNGEISKAIQILKILIEKNPDLSKSPEIRTKIIQLEKKSG